MFLLSGSDLTATQHYPEPRQLMITSRAMNLENNKKDYTMEVASETRGIQMKRSKQQNTAEGRYHVSNEGLQMQSGRDSRGVGQCGTEIFNRKGAENSYEHNTWKISKPQKGRILDPTEMIIRESKLAISCLSFCP